MLDYTDLQLLHTYHNLGYWGLTRCKTFYFIEKIFQDRLHYCTIFHIHSFSFSFSFSCLFSWSSSWMTSWTVSYFSWILGGKKIKKIFAFCPLTHLLLYQASSLSRIRRKFFSSGRLNCSHWISPGSFSYRRQ